MVRAPTTGSSSIVDATPLDPHRRGILLVVGILRGVLLAWATLVVVLDARGGTDVRVWLGAGLLVVLASWSALLTGWVRRSSALALSGGVGAVDLLLGVVAAAADHVVYGAEHPQSFASAWPMSAAIVAGVLRGTGAGTVAGVVIGLGAAAGTAAFAPDGLQGRVTASVGTVVLLAVAGGLAGRLSTVLRSAELAVARSRAREEVARTLHDGVLQTLAVIQRRSDDDELVALARDQEAELRRYLAAPPGDSVGDTDADLLDALRRVAAETAARCGMRCELTVVEAPRRTSPEVVEAVSGATREALVNAHKHGDAQRAVVCVDVEHGELHCSVVDDGRGFEVASVPEGTGLTRSVRGRLEELGGRVQVTSSAGTGTEVHLWCMPDSTHAA